PGQFDRQVLVLLWNHPALLAVEHRDRRAPVALARDAPVLQAVLDRALTDATAAGHLGQLRASLVGRQAVVLAGIDQHTIRLRRCGQDIGGCGVAVLRTDDDRDGQTVLPRELEVALVVTGNAHDRAGAVL